VAATDNARTKRQSAVEVIALNVFGTADRVGQLVTRRMVSERLADLGGHPAGCGCGLCGLLPLVTATKVWPVASRWQTDVNLTRLAAQRCAVPGQATTARVAV
jgi:hypothetical protein